MNNCLAETRKYFQSFPDNRKSKADGQTNSKISKDCQSACIPSSNLFNHNVNLDYLSFILGVFKVIELSGKKKKKKSRIDLLLNLCSYY